MQASPKKNNKIAFIAILALPVIGLAISSWLYFFGQSWVDAGVTNQGHLLSEPIALAKLGLVVPGAGKWRILLVSKQACTGQCAVRAERLNSIKTLLGKNGPRIVPVAVTDFSSEAPFMSKWPQVNIRVQAIQVQLARAGVAVQDDYYALLADPNGYIILFYPPDKIGAALLMDIKHLLKLSKIG